MAQLKFNVNIPSPPEKLKEIVLDFENLTRFFNYLEYVKILEKNENQTITKEKVSFEFHAIKYEIIQQTKTIIENNKINSEISSGPLKGTTIEILFEESEIGTTVYVDTDLKVGLKFKILLPLIKQKMKMALIAILYKMHTIIIESEEVSN